jgi:hypothetical protein
MATEMLDDYNDPLGLVRRGCRYFMNPVNGDCMWATPPLDKWPGAIDCTDMDEDQFAAALLAAGCKVYTDEYLALVEIVGGEEGAQ